MCDDITFLLSHCSIDSDIVGDGQSILIGSDAICAHIEERRHCDRTHSNNDVTCPTQRRIHVFYTGMFPVGDTSSGTLIAVCVCVCVSLSADISLYCAKNDSTDYPEILWVCWV